MKVILRSWVLFLSGFLTVLLIFVIPDSGGGKAMVIIFTLPSLIILGLILALAYYFSFRKSDNLRLMSSVYKIMLIAMILLSFILFPY